MVSHFTRQTPDNMPTASTESYHAQYVLKLGSRFGLKSQASADKPPHRCAVQPDLQMALLGVAPLQGFSCSQVGHRAHSAPFGTKSPLNYFCFSTLMILRFNMGTILYFGASIKNRETCSLLKYSVWTPGSYSGRRLWLFPGINRGHTSRNPALGPDCGAGDIEVYGR